MPRYDYQCQNCSEIFEAEHGFDHEGPVPCPTCESEDTIRIILTAPGIRFNWWNAKAASEATLPKYLGPVQNKKAQRRAMKEEEERYGEDYGI